MRFTEERKKEERGSRDSRRPHTSHLVRPSHLRLGRIVISLFSRLCVAAVAQGTNKEHNREGKEGE
jgi:hypothetical protein